ncbi:MAG: Ribonucleoside-diphosphate reductase subunit alpha, partial [Pseudomonadota bacterium]
MATETIEINKGDFQQGSSAVGGAPGAKRAERAATAALPSEQERLSCFTVVKRNGMLVPFRRDRIFSAIESAFRATHDISIVTPLPQNLYSAVQGVTEEVVKEATAKAKDGACLTVEGIQDIVELKLMQGGYYDVGRRYIVYRDEHKLVRDDSPRNLKVLRRDGKTLVRFNPMKIASAIERGFRATLKIEGNTPQEVIDSVNLLTNRVVQRVMQLSKEGTELHIELIQDEVERQMMAEGYYKVAKDFILYRAERATARALEDTEPAVEESAARQLPLDVDTGAPGRTFKVVAKDKSTFTITERELRKRIEFASRGYDGVVNSELILEESLRNFYENIRADEVDQSNVMAARARVEKEPAYSYVAARLLLDVIYRETIGVDAHNPKLEELHAEYFKRYLKHAVEVERIDPALLDFDLDKLGKAMKVERDQQFTFLGVQTLYDRYLIHHEDVRIETPQIFWMRVSMGLALLEGEQKNDRAIEFYNVLSRFLFTSSTPTLFNSGTLHSQMSSCYLTTTMDDLQHIFKIISDDAQLSKWAGGLGNDWTNVRATGARIKGTNGRSQGVIPFLKVANDTAVAVNQGGKRKGAMCAYLETWHLDIEDFLDLRKNTGDERRRTHDMNTANWIPDLFMKRVAQNGS